MVIEMTDYGTFDGKPITEEMLEALSAEFERDWQLEEITVVPTRIWESIAGFANA